MPENVNANFGASLWLKTLAFKMATDLFGGCVCVCVCVCVIYQNHELGKYKMDEYCLCAENGFTL